MIRWFISDEYRSKGDAALAERAIAVSTPFDLHAASLKLDNGLSAIYQRHLVNRLIKRYQDKFRHQSSPLSVEVEGLRDFFRNRR